MSNVDSWWLLYFERLNQLSDRQAGTMMVNIVLDGHNKVKVRDVRLKSNSSKCKLNEISNMRFVQ